MQLSICWQDIQNLFHCRIFPKLHLLQGFRENSTNLLFQQLPTLRIIGFQRRKMRGQQGQKGQGLGTQNPGKSCVGIFGLTIWLNMPMVYVLLAKEKLERLGNNGFAETDHQIGC